MAKESKSATSDDRGSGRTTYKALIRQLGRMGLPTNQIGAFAKTIQARLLMCGVCCFSLILSYLVLHSIAIIASLSDHGPHSHSIPSISSSPPESLTLKVSDMIGSDVIDITHNDVLCCSTMPTFQTTRRGRGGRKRVSTGTVKHRRTPRTSLLSRQIRNLTRQRLCELDA